MLKKLSIIGFLSFYLASVSAKEIAVQVDLNDDQKVDQVNYSDESGRLFKSKLDKNFDGFFEEEISYFQYVNDTSPVSISHFDQNKSGKNEIKLSIYKNIALGKLIFVKEISQNDNGLFDLKVVTYDELTQTTDLDQCLSTIIPRELRIEELNKSVSNINSRLNQGFVITDFGYKLHQSCLEKWGADNFIGMLKNGMGKGMACLKKLAVENKKNKTSENGALYNLLKLTNLMKGNNISIVCNEDKFNWEATAAHASTDDTDKIQNPKVNHPFISVNSTYPKVKSRPEKDEVSFMTSILFHEQLHNLGIKHGEGIEYPYACDECCFSGDDLKPNERDKKESACRICSGNYKSASDKKYVMDMVDWGQKAYKQDRAARAVLKYQRENPKERVGMFMYADATSGIFNPVGIEVAKALSKKYAKLSKEEAEMLERSLKYKDVDDLKDLAVVVPSQAVAEATLSYYQDNQADKALEAIKNKKTDILAIIKAEANISGNRKYVYSDIKDKTKKILSDIWLMDYPNTSKKESSEAYKLLTELKLLD